jgi:hypothetical protein
MAKKVLKPRTVAEISTASLTKFAASLVGTAHNVFTRARLNWGDQLAADDALFDRLKAECRVEKCENCDVWKTSAEMDRKVSGYCTECVDEMNGESPADEE